MIILIGPINADGPNEADDVTNPNCIDLAVTRFVCDTVALITFLHLTGIKWDIVCISETWLNSDV